MSRPGGAIDRRILLGVLAAVFAGGAVVLAHRWVSEQRRLLKEKEAEIMKNYQAPIEVLVAARDLPEGTTLEPGDLRLESIPERYVQPYAVRSAQELLGQVTGARIARGEQVLATKVRQPGEAPSGDTLSSVTPKGKRAVTIAVDTMTGVGGFVRPGDIVDILWTIALPDGSQKDGQVVTLTVFQDVPVLAVGGQIVGRPAHAPGEGEQETKEYTVTLALSPQETSFLLFAREQGRIQLSLRSNTEERQAVAVVPANINTLLEMQLGIKPQGGGQASPGRQVEVYRGLKRDIVALSEGE